MHRKLKTLKLNVMPTHPIAIVTMLYCSNK